MQTMLEGEHYIMVSLLIPPISDLRDELVKVTREYSKPLDVVEES